jgi:molybdopterin molybdotransferase
MIPVEEAYSIIMEYLFHPSRVEVPLEKAIGKVLAEPVYADRDFPPFDRVAMDGVAVAHERLVSGQREFSIEGIQSAGTPQKKLQDISKCMEVMTGAVLPGGTDIVIKYEDLHIKEGIVHIIQTDFQSNQHIHKRSQDVHQGDELLEPGIVLSPAEIALLASVGKSTVFTQGLPQIAIVSTGNELVEVTDVPESHQIRKSNSYALAASLSQLGCVPTMNHLRDDKEIIGVELAVILKNSDAVILSGGVSKGKFDYIPEALEKLGVKKLFHQVSQRPGKPFWFGATASGKIVFALPGNPVATFLCFYKYIRPWLLESLGTVQRKYTAILADDFTFSPKLSYFLQVTVKSADGKWMAFPAPGGGSADFANLKEVDGFLELPAEKTDFQKGEVFPFIPFRS